MASMAVENAKGMVTGVQANKCGGGNGNKLAESNSDESKVDKVNN